MPIAMLTSGLLVLHALAALLRPPPAAARCSLVPVKTMRGSAVTYLVARAEADTVRAGPGAVLASRGPGHWGVASPDRPVYGQLVSVERLGGAQADAIARAFRATGARRVVLVPWDYDPACEPTPWARSARWVTDTAPGFYTAALRPAAQWVGGRPTLDVYAADLEPYPHGLLFRRGYRSTAALRAGPGLTPDEYFSLYAALPEPSHAARAPREAEAALAAWERAHPDAARKYPASEILPWARRALARQ